VKSKMSFLTPSQPATRPPSASSTWPPPLNPPRSQHKPSGSWRRWAEVKLNLLRLPHDVVAGDVLLSLQSEGTIVYVKIHKHDRNTTALVVFRFVHTVASNISPFSNSSAFTDLLQPDRSGILNSYLSCPKGRSILYMFQSSSLAQAEHIPFGLDKVQMLH
jgi:hypothetical protein